MDETIHDEDAQLFQARSAVLEIKVPNSHEIPAMSEVSSAIDWHMASLECRI